VKKILISGYYGFDNAGDEAVLQAILDSLKKEVPYVKPIVLSANPDKTAKEYNIEAINRFKLKAIIKAIKEADGLISGGGSLLQDETGIFTIPYYLVVIKLAQFYGKPTFIYAQGVGPVKRKFFYSLISHTFRKTKYISVRDRESALLLNSMGVPINTIDIVADPVLNLVPAKKERVEEIMQKENIIQPPILISVRFWKNNKEYLETIAKVADQLIKQGEQIVLIPMHEPNDRHASEYVINRMNEEATILEAYDEREILGIIAESKCMIGMRLHALIFATAMGVPAIGISYDPKIDQFLAKLNQTPVGTVDDLDFTTLYDQIKHVITHLEENKQELDKKLPQLKELAYRPAKSIEEFFKEN